MTVKALLLVMFLVFAPLVGHGQQRRSGAAKPSRQRARPNYTDEQIIQYGKSIDVHILDSSLASERLDDWLRSGPPHVDSLRWLADDTCDIKPYKDIDYPLCARIEFGRGQQWGYFLVLLGTLKKGIVGPPKLYEGIEVWEEAFIQTGGTDRLSGIPDLLGQPVVTHQVTELYQKIVARHPIGIPNGADKAALWPFLSGRLTQQLETAQACEDDYFLQQRKATGAQKPGWLIRDLFSGENNRAAPFFVNTVHKEPGKDGAFDVTLDVNERSVTRKNDFIVAGGIPAYAVKRDWPVVVSVVPEDNRYVVDDIRIYEDRDGKGPSHLLSQFFVGCDGAHWVGLPATK